ncbi:unnamed protein product [Protopolystoma xenopodis]|uniref:Uncharacterized protein n=1 Tax=Protopolystoma xenopodis TaxID=117903 RepID=A0A3S5A5X0_9PLAT|nr:unnamed protein product [Protopolystoma xenopodis]
MTLTLNASCATLTVPMVITLAIPKNVTCSHYCHTQLVPNYALIGSVPPKNAIPRLVRTRTKSSMMMILVKLKLNQRLI